ncbi:DUF2304 domain-containing protein [Arthrobacter gengyunqii]|uniref:DUF2304 domain-containing protein n=1 Tax=Arthrobacter gengyunqii TaxID=2886940 RepID=A0ABS8GKJ2_9MICC|nr:DUF2304 domain-containing protein [Arthrobacter gengyunqii]MCC3267162.1 DUF2304 domain-containing protein [Arthrobacter gengyunqii]
MIIIVQIVLVLAVILVALALMRGGSNARHLAIRRILLLIFAAAAVFSIFFPAVLSSVAEILGVGRGTDLVLYATIICFFVYMATTYQRFRSLEISITKLSRRLALDETEHPGERGLPSMSSGTVDADGNTQPLQGPR